MENFLKHNNPNIHENSLREFSTRDGKNYWNIPNIKIKEKYIHRCRMYYFNEKETNYNQRTIVFENYFNPFDLELMSDAFEEFLILNNISYQKRIIKYNKQ